MVYFPECGEWAELSESQFKRVNKPGHIPKKNRDFVKRLRRMKITLVT